MSRSFAGMIRQKLVRDSPIKYGWRYGHAFFHRLIRIFGVWPAYVILAVVVIPYYALIRSSARKADYYYLARRFPGQNRFMRFVRSTRHIFSFSKVLADQAAMGVLGREKVNIDFPAAERLLEISRRKRGLVLITAHVGNFLGSMITSRHFDVSTNVVLDTSYYQGNHFFDLAREEACFRIIPPTLEGLVVATNALQAGEIVVLMGDRKDKSRTIDLPFLGKNARFPVTPYHLAVATDSDVGLLLTTRTGKLKFRMEFEVIRDHVDLQKLEKETAIVRMAEKYVESLESYVKRYPYMWYNFFDFWA